MHNSFKYINLSWAVVGICENPHQPLSSCIPSIEEDKAAAVEHYVIGYMAFWHIAFVDEDCLVQCQDDVLRTEARQKIDRHIADHPPSRPSPASTSSFSASPSPRWKPTDELQQMIKSAEDWIKSLSRKLSQKKKK